MTQKIKNQSYYFTNGGSGVDLPNLVLICEKKNLLERELEKRDSLRRESYREEEREIEKKELQRGRESLLVSERVRDARATERNKKKFRLFYRKENRKTISCKIAYFFNSFLLTIFYGATKHRKTVKYFTKNVLQ